MTSPLLAWGAMPDCPLYGPVSTLAKGHQQQHIPICILSLLHYFYFYSSACSWENQSSTNHTTSMCWTTLLWCQEQQNVELEVSVYHSRRTYRTTASCHGEMAHRFPHGLLSISKSCALMPTTRRGCKRGGKNSFVFIAARSTSILRMTRFRW